MCVKVMITDDHTMMREGIRHLLEFDGSVKVIAEAKDGNECLEVLRSLKELPEVLLLDINMPDKNGIDAL